MRLSVHIAAMPDLKDCDGLFDVTDSVNHAIVADANSPALPIAKFLAARCAGDLAQAEDSCFGGIVDRGVQPRKLFFRVRQDAEIVTHLPFLSRSILSTASSNGTGVSPEAIASSYARRSSRSSSSWRIFSYSSMLMTTATLSPRSFTTNWRSLPMGVSLRGSLLPSRKERNPNKAGMLKSATRRQRKTRLSVPRGRLLAGYPPGRRASCGACLLFVFRGVCVCA